MEPNPMINATWHVLHRIKNSLSGSKDSAPFNLYDFGANSDTPSSELQYEALAMLRHQGIITFNDGTPIAFIERDTDGNVAFQYTQYKLTVINSSELHKIYEQHKALAGTLAAKSAVTIRYDNTCIRIDGLSFTLRGKNKKVFNLLYKRANQWVSQADLLKTVRYDKDYGSKAANLDFNTYIGNLRKALGLKPWHIAVSDKHVILKCKTEQ